jgi:hypothetical protein
MKNSMRSMMRSKLAAPIVFVVMSANAKASIYELTFASTIIAADTPGIPVGNTFTINLFLDNGGSTVVSQSWSGTDAISGFTIDAGTYHGSYSTLLANWSFQTDASGALTLTNFFGTATTSNNQDNFGSFQGNDVFGNEFVDSLDRVNHFATGLSTVSSWTIAPVATPLPATLPLFASGLGALSLLGWRRKWKAQAAA